MGFTTRADYRGALRDHRSLVATICIFIALSASSFVGIVIVLSGAQAVHLVGHLPHGVAWIVGTLGRLVLGTLLTWIDAAQRLAGRQLRSR